MKKKQTEYTLTLTVSGTKEFILAKALYVITKIGAGWPNGSTRHYKYNLERITR